ncbi:methyltransferase domain-containing protein [Pedobacter alpinus]|uniref:Methyltransferase domain-containing protein n=1 Tax=Pedobacter alpinus TaxID=1590643 RepID=A0ABW5TMP8_9SPHI
MKPIIIKFIPKVWLRFYADFKTKNKTAETIFTEIYKKQYWGKNEADPYFSGTGTHDDNTTKYISALKHFINENNIKSVFEIGCGDFSIMQQVLINADINYTGADIVTELVQHLLQNFGNLKTNFIHFDAVSSEIYPDADLCVIRQVLQHLSNTDIQQILEKTKKYKYVIITEHVPLKPEEINGDKSVNGYIRLQNKKTSGVFLAASPFSQQCETILSYAKNDENRNGEIIPAIMVSSLIINA